MSRIEPSDTTFQIHVEDLQTLFSVYNNAFENTLHGIRRRNPCKRNTALWHAWEQGVEDGAEQRKYRIENDIEKTIEVIKHLPLNQDFPKDGEPVK